MLLICFFLLFDVCFPKNSDVFLDKLKYFILYKLFLDMITEVTR